MPEGIYPGWKTRIITGEAKTDKVGQSGKGREGKADEIAGEAKTRWGGGLAHLVRVVS
jgi:hypothetical protein